MNGSKRREKTVSDVLTTKKNVWKETVEKNDVLFILPGIILVLAFGMLLGWLLTFTPFPIMTIENVREEVRASAFTRYSLFLVNGWIYTLVLMALGGLLYISVVCPLKKQVAIMRYCKLPLTAQRSSELCINERGNAHGNQYRIIL